MKLNECSHSIRFNAIEGNPAMRGKNKPHKMYLHTPVHKQISTIAGQFC